MTDIARGSRPRGLLRTHALLVLAGLVVTVGGALALVLLRPADYVATTQVSVGAEQTGGTALRPEMASEREIVKSGVVRAQAAYLLDVDPARAATGLSVSIVVESSILDIHYTAPTAAAATDGARAFAEAYVGYRNGVAGTRLTRVVTWPDQAQRTSGRLSLVLAAALMAGAAVGVAAAWAWDRTTDRIRDAAELTEQSALPLFAEVPRWQAGLVAPAGPARRAFAYVAARVHPLLPPGPAGVVIVVTSPRAGAGTTTVAVNTALAVAALGREVRLVGGDVHSPGLHDILGEAEGAERVEVVPAPGTPDLLRALLDRLREGAVVIVDAPPVLESAESLTICDAADVLLLVADLRRGRRADLREATVLLDRPLSAVAGWVANLPRRTSSPQSDETLALGPGTGWSQVAEGRSDRVAG